MLRNYLDTVAEVIRAFGVSSRLEASKIQNLKITKSQLYGLCDVISFDFNGRHYYISCDYSLDDNPDYFKNILLDINHLLEGEALRNPNKNSELKYSVNIDDTPYYLWQT